MSEQALPVQSEMFAERHWHFKICTQFDYLSRLIDEVYPETRLKDRQASYAERKAHRLALRAVLLPAHALLPQKVNLVFNVRQLSLMRQDRLCTVQAALFDDLLTLLRAVKRGPKSLMLDKVVSSYSRFLAKAELLTSYII